eukprot:TRINITY_DN24606_c0_g1_i1.p1 TRINITY_DN24606_c0_g1~~TRINITY_DN24606_c0_g1_i1.p1  ORF type:complete len:228 (-),score=41.93 TRINITY_DN24606_c0_g1_i1:332-1015(-)
MCIRDRIYNYKELYAAMGRVGMGTSDVEVVLHCYLDTNGDMVQTCQQLDGDFALVLADGERLVAARDPLGVKPLYMAEDGPGRTWFGSEIKALTGLGTVSSFPPGFVYDSKGGWQQFYQPPWREFPRTNPSDEVPELQLFSLLETAVRKRLMADVPVGVLLSGGLDSSIVAALAARHSGRPLRSFAIGTAESADILAAREVASLLGLEHTEVRLTLSLTLMASNTLR